MNVIRVVRREPNGCPADVVGLPDPFIWNELHQFAIGFWRSPGFHIDGSANRARADRIHADAMRRHFLSDAFHHEHYTALAGGVIHMARPWNHLMNAAHANDLPRSAGNLLADAPP